MSRKRIGDGVAQKAQKSYSERMEERYGGQSLRQIMARFYEAVRR